MDLDLLGPKNRCVSTKPTDPVFDSRLRFDMAFCNIQVLKLEGYRES